MGLNWAEHTVEISAPTVADGVESYEGTLLEGNVKAFQSRWELEAVEPARTRLGIVPAARVVLFFGRINPYKGVTDLLEAWPAVVDEIPDAVLLVAGACDDADLRFAIENRAGVLGPSVRLLLEPIAEELIPVLFSAAEFTCLPCRSVTTSGSAILAAGLGRLLIPELQTLGDVAGAQVARYQPGPDGLREGLVRALREPPAPAVEPGPGPAPEWTVSAEAHAALFRSLHLAPASPSHRTKGTDVASAA